MRQVFCKINIISFRREVCVLRRFNFNNPRQTVEPVKLEVNEKRNDCLDEVKVVSGTGFS
jgi:hypothetical protein